MTWYTPDPMRLISSEKMMSLSTAFVALAALCRGAVWLDRRHSHGLGLGCGCSVVLPGAIGLVFVLVWLAGARAAADWQVPDYGSGQRLPVWV